MDSARIQSSDEPFIMSERASRPYAITFDADGLKDNTSSCAIPIKSRREVELLLLSLGEEANVIMDKQARIQHPDIWEWLYGRTYSEICADLKWSYREEKEILDIIERIPLSKSFNDSYLKNCNSEPKRINQDYVHKQLQENVLISEPYRIGNMYYFNGFKTSSEIRIDHESDHLEGIIIFEAARQAGIASAHLSGMPLSGAIVILENVTRYTNFVNYQEPYVIRTIPACKSRGGRAFCVYNIVQDGKSCASGYFSCFTYSSQKSYQKFRNSKLVEKVSKNKLFLGPNLSENPIVDNSYLPSH
jgi:hypothetical protein